LARSIADLRALQTVLDPTLRQATPVDSSIRFGTCAAYFADSTDEILVAMETVIRHLNARDLTIPLPDEALAFHMINLPREAADYHLSQFADQWLSYPEVARETVALGRTISIDTYNDAEANRRSVTERVNAALAEVDVIVLPTMAMDAPLRDARVIRLGGRDMTKLSATIRYTAIFNQTGHPVVSLPAALLPDGRAMSIQLIGRKNEDNLLLSIADRVDALLAAHVNYPSLTRALVDQAARIKTGLWSKP
jgi:aspartyl-tRNA(Asn)/glutamyl-tRNA(Gln) amidotransferase subunit A